jgi:hypothetical protein
LTKPAKFGELQAIHGTGHLNVGKNDVNVQARFENRNRFVGVASFDHVKTCIANYICRVHPQQKFVVDDKNDRPLGRESSHGSPGANAIQAPGSGLVPREGKTANRARALGDVHRPAGIYGFAAHYIPDHRFAEGARRVVVCQRHASRGLTVAAIGVTN